MALIRVIVTDSGGRAGKGDSRRAHLGARSWVPTVCCFQSFGFSRTSDPVGEFGGNLWNRGFSFPGSRILLMFRPIDR